MSQLAQTLQTKLKGEVLTDEKTLKTFSRDTSIYEIKPEAVIYPADREDLAALVKFVAENKKSQPNLSITPRSAGTDMSGGAINDSIVLDFTKHFNHVKEIGNDYGLVEPGVFYRDFEKETLAHNLYFPSFPASKAICALGGIVNNNAGGEESLTHGQTVDYVQELKVILRDGKEYIVKPLSKDELKEKMKGNGLEAEIYEKVYKLIEANYNLIKEAKPKVSKNSTAYNLWDVWDRETFDLTKLFVGGQGTLGLVTEIKLGLIPTKKFRGTLVVYLEQLEKLPELIHTIVQTKPDCFETFDDHTLRLALKKLHIYTDKHKLGFWGAVSMWLHFLTQAPMFVTQGIPKFTLLAQFEGDTQAEIDEKLNKLAEQISHFNVKIIKADTKAKSEKFWAIRRDSFNLLRLNAKNSITAPYIDDFIVNPDHILEFLPKLIAILEKYNLAYTVAGHMGDGNFHIIPLMNFSKEEDRKKVGPSADEVYDLVLKYKGSISAEHNDGLVRGQYLEKMYGEKMYQIFREVKKIFDPDKIFNPHKKTEATTEYSSAHIRMS